MPSTNPDGGYSVLLVDDDLNAAAMYRMGLEAAGFDVTVAVNGRDALSNVNQDVPDAIVLDWQMPVMDGEEFLRALRRDQRTETVLVVVLSNSVPHERINEFARVARAKWLVKARTPPAELARQLLDLLAKANSFP